MRWELPSEFPPCRSTCRIRLDCTALGRSEATGSYETLAGAFLGGSANGTAPAAAAGLAVETPDDWKDMECASLPEAFGRTERAISEVMHPLLVRRSSLLPAQLFTASPAIER